MVQPNFFDNIFSFISVLCYDKQKSADEMSTLKSFFFQNLKSTPTPITRFVRVKVFFTPIASGCLA